MLIDDLTGASSYLLHRSNPQLDLPLVSSYNPEMMLSLPDLDFLNWFEIANVPTVVVEVLFLRRLLFLFLENRFVDLHGAPVQIVLTFHMLSGLN